ncbi:MAG: acylneuraminate cytidylyltransferase family protein [Peptostreptococcaceae bacterium]|nr:acylneuraminate cytidylyltransferase family protein [Peptostreptococcaceae bacterium]
MINGRSVLAIIPARGGSKGIPNKNITDLGGKPLIVHSIIVAQNSKYIDNIFVSTDSKSIAAVSEKYGVKVPSLRPSEMATDQAKIIDVIIQCIADLKRGGLSYDIIVLLQPTQPLRTSQDIDAALETFLKNDCKAVVGVSEVTDSPVLIRKINDEGILENMLGNVQSTVRRQDMEKYYRVNGAVYINLASEINKDLSFNDNKIPFVMDKSRSIDIDEELDLLIAEAILNRGRIN